MIQSSDRAAADKLGEIDNTIYKEKSGEEKNLATLFIVSNKWYLIITIETYSA
jgi:hypothetical protein